MTEDQWNQFHRSIQEAGVQGQRNAAKPLHKIAGANSAWDFFPYTESIWNSPIHQGHITPSQLASPLPPASDPGSVRANADPVALSNGEFVHSAVDLEVLAGRLPFRLVRSYRNRMKFKGPLGPSWDHNFNARIFFNPNPASCASEHAISLGDLHPVHLRPDNVDSLTYHSTDASRWTLHRQNASDCAWQLKLPSGIVYCFDADGFSTKIQDPSGEHIDLQWVPIPVPKNSPIVTTLQIPSVILDLKMAKQKRLSLAKRVLAGQATHEIQFHYDDFYTESLTSVDLLATLGSKSVLETVSYEYIRYDLDLLKSVTSNGKLREAYSYYISAYEPENVLPLKNMNAYCDSLCNLDRPSECGPSLCEQRADLWANTTCVATLYEDFKRDEHQIPIEYVGVGRRKVVKGICTVKNCGEIGCGPLCQQMTWVDEHQPDEYKSLSTSSRACSQPCGKICDDECDNACNPFANLDQRSACHNNCNSTCHDKCNNKHAIQSGCQLACHDQCVAMASKPQTFIYGQPADLNNNIISIKNGDERIFVRNLYGEDPRYPNFDAVIEQFMGNDDPTPMRFYYNDFDSPLNPPQSSRTFDPHAPDGTLRICSLSSLDFLDDIESALYPQPKPNPFDWSAPESPNDRINPADVNDRINPAIITRLDVLTPQRLALRAASLPPSATLKIGSTLTPLVLNSDRLYESARPIARVSPGETLSARLRDNVLEVIATVASTIAHSQSPDFSSDCTSSTIQYDSIASDIRALSRAASSTRVTRADGSSMVAYYNSSGDIIRIHEVDRKFFDEFEWDADHNLIGKLRLTDAPVNGAFQPLTPRVCTTYNDRGLPTTVSQYTIDAPLNPSKQCFAWDSRGPWPTAATAPNDSNILLFERSYDDAGRILTVKTEDNSASSHEYDSLGHLTHITRQDGSVTKLSDFDPLSNQPLTIIEDSLGVKRKTSFTYDAFGHATSIDRHGWGPNETWKWEDRVRMTSRTVSGSEKSFSEQYLYTKSGLLQEVNGLTTTKFEYNDAGWPIRKVEFNPAKPNDKRITCMRRRQDGSISETIDPMGVAWSESLSYYDHDLYTQVSLRANTDPSCAVPTDVEGDPLPLYPVIVERRDGADHLTERQDLSGRFSLFTYDGFGRLASTTDEAQTTSHLLYDTRHRQVTTIVNQGAPLPASITQAPEPAHLTDVQGLLSATFLGYGPDGQLSRQQTYAMGNGLEPVSDELYQHSPASRSFQRTVSTAKGNAVWTTKWDALGRLISQTNTVGHALTVSYPSISSRVLSQVGPDGNAIVTTERLDDFGNVLEQLDSKEKLLSKRVVDAFGRTKTEITGQSQLDLSYDPWSHVSSAVQTIESDPTKVLSSKTYHFDPRGRLASVALGDVPTVSFGYDHLGRVVRETRSGRNTLFRYVGASSRPSSQALPSGRILAYEYKDPRKLLTAITADASKAQDVVGQPQQRAEFSYDALGLVQTATLTGSGANPWTTAQQYDGVGRLRLEIGTSVPSTRLDYGLGLGVTRQTIGEQSFDFNRYPDNRIQSIVSQASGSVVAYTFKGSGPAKKVIYGNGSVETRSFDDRGRILRQDLGSALNLTNEYDASGNTTLAKMVGASYHDKLNLYPDEAGRVASEILETSASAHYVVYSIDPANNWTSIERDDSELLITAPDVFHAYAATPSGSATYDADGRQRSAGQTSFAYDAFGRLARVQNANTNSTCSYNYDALGRRVRELCDGRETFFGYSGDNLVVEQSQSGAIATIHAGLSSPVLRVSLSAPNQKTYFVTGKDGSVRAALSQSGDVIESYAYTAFGDTTVTQMPGQQPTGNRFRFQGHFFDPIAGLYQMRARYYAPSWGRFLTPDPLGVAATGNPYAFVNNRPADLWDPFGLSPVANPYAQSISQAGANGHVPQGRGQVPAWLDNALTAGYNTLYAGPASFFVGMTDTIENANQYAPEDGSHDTEAFLKQNVAARFQQFGLSYADPGSPGAQFSQRAATVLSFYAGGFSNGNVLVAESNSVRSAAVLTSEARALADPALLLPAARALPELGIGASKYPELATNISNALKAGHPEVLTHGGNVAANRAAALEGIPNILGLSRDEFPFASAIEGGVGAWVGHIPAIQQSAQGGLISTFVRANGILPGMQYRVVILP